jgi:SAM-dependent methyltransferase
MVYLESTAQINNAFASMVGRYEYASHIHRPDGEAALQLANLQPGETVLELGAGSGRLIASAKQKVGAGFCVAVDAVQGFLSTDIPWALNQKGLTVYPAGGADQQVHLLHANITDNGLATAIRALPGAPQQFDCIVALHIFTTMPAHQRRQTLINLRQLLRSTGRLILNMSARFPGDTPTAAEVNLPVQFRTTGHTEVPGSHIMTAFHAGPLVQVPRGGAGQPPKTVSATLQIAPDRLWVTAAAQATQAAVDAGFLVHTVRNIGKGSDFGLPPGQRSPPQSTLQAMSVPELGEAASSVMQPGAHGCIGRILDRIVRCSFKKWDQATTDARDYGLVESLQAMTLRDRNQVQANNASLPANGVLFNSLEFAQVGVIVVLGKL